MDIYCPKCGEPWEIDTFHDVADDQGRTFRDVMREFQNVGCVATGWVSPDDCRPSMGGNRGAIASALYEILGDDVDGCASMFEDMDYMTGGDW